MPSRLRISLFSGGLARPNVRVGLSAYLGPDEPILHFASLQSDRTGFLAADLPDDVDPRRIRISVPGRPDWETELVDPPVDRDRPVLVPVEVPVELPAERAGTLPAMLGTHPLDSVVSPASFSAPESLTLGEGVCETLVPSSIADRTFAFPQIVIDRQSRVEDLSGDDNQGLTFTRARPALWVEYEMIWEPLGHALGEVVYSLPLAPCESVDIAVVEWSRRDETRRTDTATASERLTHDQRRDRAVAETVDATLREWQKGETVTLGAGVSAGTSGIGVSGSAGVSWTSTNSGRDVTSESLQELSDSLAQASSNIRNLRSTVIVQSSQTEREVIQTRTIRNHNPCHALTILYYEVLRQYRVSMRRRRVRDVMLLRWRQFGEAFDAHRALIFRTYLQDALIDRSLAPGFDALARRTFGRTMTDGEPVSPVDPGSERIVELTVWVATPAPTEGANVDDNRISFVTMDIIRTDDPRPMNYNISTGGLPLDGALTSRTINLLTDLPGPAIDDFAPLTRNALLRIDIGTSIRSDGISPDGDEWQLGTVVFEYRVEHDPVPRVLYDSRDPSFPDPPFPLPHYFRDRGSSGAARWRTPNFALSDSATDAQPPPERIDYGEVLADTLLEHLNAHRGHYWRAVAARLDRNDFATMLDSVPFRGETLLEQVDYHPLAIVGPYLVFETFEETSDAAERLISAPTPEGTRLVALPTRGVFAEAKLGHCNACGEVDVTRIWNSGENPCRDDPPEIAPVAAGSRARDVTPDPAQVPASVLNVVSPSAVPDPSGMAAALELLGRSDVFRDVTGSANLSSLLSTLATEARQAGRASTSSAASRSISDRARAAQAATQRLQDAGLITDEQSREAGEEILENTLRQHRDMSGGTERSEGDRSGGSSGDTISLSPLVDDGLIQNAVYRRLQRTVQITFNEEYEVFRERVIRDSVLRRMVQRDRVASLVDGSNLQEIFRDRISPYFVTRPGRGSQSTVLLVVTLDLEFSAGTTEERVPSISFEAPGINLFEAQGLSAEEVGNIYETSHQLQSGFDFWPSNAEVLALGPLGSSGEPSADAILLLNQMFAYRDVLLMHANSREDDLEDYRRTRTAVFSAGSHAGEPLRPGAAQGIERGLEAWRGIARSDQTRLREMNHRYVWTYTNEATGAIRQVVLTLRRQFAVQIDSHIGLWMKNARLTRGRDVGPPFDRLLRLLGEGRVDLYNAPLHLLLDPTEVV